MDAPAIRRYALTLIAGLLLLACAQTAPQLKKEDQATPPDPDCRKNYQKELNLFSGWAHRSWVKYDQFDFSRAVDSAVQGLEKTGYRVLSVDRESGNISGETMLGSPQQIAYPIDVRIERKGQDSLVVHFRSKAPRGALDPWGFCTFYAEFERLMLMTPLPPPLPEPTPERAATFPEKIQEVRESAPEPPQVIPQPAPTLSPPAPEPLPKAIQVMYSNVNLREGPGMNYKVIGNVKRGTSLSVLEEKEGWFRVRLKDRKEAWVIKSCASDDGKGPSSKPPAPVQKSKRLPLRSPM